MSFNQSQATSPNNWIKSSMKNILYIEENKHFQSVFLINLYSYQVYQLLITKMIGVK